MSNITAINPRRWMLPVLMMASMCTMAQQTFEDAHTAVANMRIGWNAGNRLDANSGNTDNMWIEAWSERKPSDYETAWGQPLITQQLIHMFKLAGFNAIRVPVTWYPHMGSVKVDPAKTDWKPVWDVGTWTGYEIDREWMARVKQVVDYVIDEGMYCILNVHHDTGDASTAWLRADETTYSQQRERFESLWTQIADTFKEYDQHLLFEGYNEMLDTYGSWCFASFAAPGNYNAAVAASAYNAINSYAQSFVNAVRATGGNNAQRNLVVCTYGACCGDGNWSAHLADPLKEMKLPTDDATGHMICEVHYYPCPTSKAQARTVVEGLLETLKAHLTPKGAPVIIGEWGVGNDEAKPYLCDLAQYLVKRAKDENIATFLWMEAANGDDCTVPRWSNTALRDAIVKGYYGEAGYDAVSAPTAAHSTAGTAPAYTLDGHRADGRQHHGIVIQGGKKRI